MILANYTPNFRQVLFHEVREEKTKGGIIIPSADFTLKTHADTFENEKEHKADGKLGDYIVVKVGKDCTDTQVKDVIFIMEMIKPQKIELEDGIFYSINEGQIIGHGTH